MLPLRHVHHSLLAVLCLIVTAAYAGIEQEATRGASYTPVPYQAGKDVPWVPSEDVLVQKMLDVAKVTSDDYVIDLGSGDGRTVIAAAKRGARAVGVEYNPELVGLSKENAAKAGVSDRAEFIEADIFDFDFSRATVLTMFLLADVNLKLRPRILTMKPGTRVVSNTFDMGEWRPDAVATVDNREKCTGFCTAYFWVVPAVVAGKWKFSEGELTLDQSFQMIFGTLASARGSIEINEARITGDRIVFSAGGARYEGRVGGNTMHLNAVIEGRSTALTAMRIDQ